jgi:hypothetical protein
VSSPPLPDANTVITGLYERLAVAEATERAFFEACLDLMRQLDESERESGLWYELMLELRAAVISGNAAEIGRTIRNIDVEIDRGGE